MLRILRRTSPMSIGTYTFGTFGVSSLVTAVREWRSKRPGAKTAAQIPAAIAGIGVMTYTAPLLSSTSNPVWARDPELRAARFGSSAVTLAASVLSLLEYGAQRRHSARALANLALVSSSVNALVSLATQAQSKRSCDPLQSREVQLYRAAEMLSTVVPVCCYVLARLAPASARTLSIVGSLCAIAGIALSKWSDVEAGKRSAEDPELYLRFAQPHATKPDEERRA
jgi:hypothetical protein